MFNNKIVDFILLLTVSLLTKFVLFKFNNNDEKTKNRWKYKMVLYKYRINTIFMCL